MINSHYRWSRSTGVARLGGGHFLTNLTLMVALLAVLFLGHEVGAKPLARPNILILAVDDLKPTLGCYEDAHAITPHIDRLAAGGLTFTRAYAQQAVCGPSRASFFTGLRPDTLRVWDLKTKMRTQRPELVTLPQYFKEQGYHTASAGKVFDPRSCDGTRTNDAISWSQPHFRGGYEGLVALNFLDPEVLPRMEAYREEALARGESERPLQGYKPVTERLEMPDNAYPDGVLAEWAVEFLESRKGQADPFFAVVGFVRPHLPFVAPRRYWDLYDAERLPLATFQTMPEGAPDFHFQDSWELRGGYGGIPKGPLPEALQRELVHGYYACVSYIDALVGQVLAGLEASGLAENTLVVLWGDHGWHLGDHGMWCKHTNYEQATRVPLILVDPRQPARGLKVDVPAESIDLAPTLTRLAGLPDFGAFEGVSLDAFFHQQESAHKPFAVSQYPRSSGEGGDGLMGYAFRSERYRIVEWLELDYAAGERDGRRVALEIYDLWDDPLETRNLAAEELGDYQADLVRELEAQAAQFARGELGVTWNIAPHSQGPD